MRIDGFTRSVCFGAGAAIGLVFTLHLAAPLAGTADTLAFYLAASLVAYAVLIGSTPRRSALNAVAALAGAAGVALLASDLAGLAIGLSLVLGVIRSGLEPSMRPARALVVETLLGFAALGFASWIGSPGWLGLAAALWGYLLVQSLYFLVPGRGRGRDVAAPGDPFERAREHIVGLLEEV